MKIYVILALLAAGLVGGYFGYQAAHRDDAPAQSTPTPRRDSPEPDARLARIDALKAKVAEQEKVVADLDAKLNQLGVGSNNVAQTTLESQIRDAQAEVDLLQTRLTDARAAVAEQSSNLSVVKSQNTATQQTDNAAYGAAIASKQVELRTLRERYRNRRALNMSMDQVLDLQNRITTSQAELDALRSNSSQVKSADAQARQSEGQLAAAVASSKADQKQIASALADARKRLNDLRAQATKQEKGDRDAFNRRDQLENQFLAAKQKLQSLRDRLAALEGTR